MKKILVANRGEIAIRVMETAKKMGIKTVAVFSTADRNAPHVKFADEAVCIGEAPSSQSYLLGDKIIAVAKELGVDGIHPGYGFLSENATFAEAVESSGITFIGPRSKAIRIMGSKLAAKDAVKGYDIPMVPGIDEAITDVAKAQEAAVNIGFPILIKASAGGGGKGMRIVEKEADFVPQMERAISEATSAFGDGSVFIEKYVGSPRHIEIQVMADSHGNILYLFERECSVQRRHQKVVEEAPSAVLTPEIRKAMGEAAVKVAKACDYLGAGTVEFLLDENKNFYFLEMNTRLQVEHPVTEMITGLDLVELQIKVARGEALDIKQEDLQINGHALELRVYAEDALNDFAPSVGHLDVYQIPVGKGIRVDNGFEQGMDVPIYYDPMLAKLITYGKTREEAIELMIEAIADYKVEGISTTLPFGTFVCEHEAFRSGDFDTHFVKKYYDAEKLKSQMDNEAEIAAYVALKQYLEDQKILRLPIQ
ncbi:acetyl-CoA carboxylase biotin carboxylase subunit [Flavobacterium salilacus subsp. salilacus]|uniref:acetyl-CoA carboxylase biotin carboxylase subunit n=1 Tax=Flavobacterium TaxID=237 RepID=UPI001074E91D|nr:MULTISPECIES: acetyl-CoA carboxylase biotin carboxylase subunit [Flavobacterium]KAF2520187.1 acetyl-CoA carboxylase biotin carboxylase subunit [Flavobacterium salilacus subsp. salilacus]MBE1613897.1 acetyl-CoA carboxylase biotin carboxylase subunit [Flavobacterium sp. SaA2.13]